MRPTVKFVDGSETLLEGVLMPFGGPFVGSDGQGRDLHGEFFSVKTDFALGLYDSRPLMYQHGLDPEIDCAPVGRITSLDVKADVGGWMTAQLDASSDYYDAIKELVQAGKLSLSSGAINYLVQANPKTGEILRWPVAEGSLTPSPANFLARIEPATAEKHFKALGLQGARFTFPDQPAGSGSPLPPGSAGAARKSLPPPPPMSSEDGDPPEGSYEDLRCDIAEAFTVLALAQGLIEPPAPYGDSYICPPSVICTFPEYAIVGLWDGEDIDYYQVGYTLDLNGEPILGEVREVEMAWVPALPDADDLAMPITAMAANLTKHFGALSARTKGLLERRTKEGRVLSAGNRSRLSSTADAMRAALTELDDLLAATEPQPAKAASVDRDRLVRLRALKLTA